MQARRDASRQAARLQLMGEISRGVAHDFNNLLCTIAGHTSLLPRLKFDSGDFALSLAAVNRAVEKGTALAGHLIELTRPIPTLMFSPLPAKSIESAANQLKDTLPSDWEYDIRVDGLPTVALSSARIEQIVLNLGIIAADQASAPGTLSVYAAPPGKVKRLFHTESYFGAVIIVTTAGVLDDTWRSPTPTEDGDSGVILSVIRSLLEQSKSRLDVIHTTHGTPIYRVCIPISSIPQDEAESSRITTELGPYLANWNILLAMRSSAGARMEVRMSKLNITLQRVESLPSLLAKVESGEALDGIVIDKSLVEEETGAIIKAIIKLCPNSAIVVMAQSPKEDDRSMLNDVVLVPNEATPNQVMLALVEAKALSVRRNRS